MPNWCEQDLYVTCDEEDKEELKLFYERFKEKLETEEIIPYADKTALREKWNTLNEEEKKRWSMGENDEEEAFNQYWFNSGGIEWCRDNWGTKWGVCNWALVEEHLKYNELQFGFNSAWSPALTVITALSRLYPKLEFRVNYFEQGCQFNGTMTAKNGEVLNEEEGKYFGDRGG